MEHRTDHLPSADRTADGGYQLSVVIALRDPSRMLPVQTLYASYKRQVERLALTYQFVFVVDGDHAAIFDELCRLKEEGEPLVIIKFARWYGDATALAAGFEQASGDIVLTLPAYFEVEPDSIPDIVSALDESDMVVVHRWPRVDSFANRLATRTFHYIVRRMVGVQLNDLTCGVRLFRRSVTDAVRIYGDQHRFFPVLVSRYGFRIKEIKVPQFKGEASRGSFAASAYVRRLLDLMSVFFLVKFTKKPLRFFGITGLSVTAVGSAIALVLAIQRLFFDVGLADRPALLLALLFVVLGVQLFALGIIGELIIFTHGRHIREYTIESIVRG